MASRGGGYVTDIAYTRGFYRELAPAWLDFAATVACVKPPSRDGSLAWCELGCGQGVTTAVLAAAHLDGRFVGIDLMPDHVAHARRLAKEAGITNAVFYAADFAAPPPELPRFDYIVAHGVYSWVAPAAQRAMLQFIERHLKPGGLVYIGYNAMPGWNATLPFQHLLLAAGRSAPGDSGARFSTALATIRAVAQAGAAALGTSAIVPQLDTLLADFPLSYLVHEYMTEHWRPLYVTELRAAMAGIGLTPAGSATLADNFDSYVLRGAERAVLETIEAADLRELARDFMRNARFRRDVFSRGGAELEDDERRDRLLAMRYALARPAETVIYDFATGAGKLTFDNDPARAIVNRLAGGPRSGGELAASGIDRQDVIANLMALCSAGAVRPVSPEDAAVGAFNGAILRRADSDGPIGVLALACGTAVRAEPALLRALRDGTDGDAETTNWRRFLRTYGAIR